MKIIFSLKKDRIVLFDSYVNNTIHNSDWYWFFKNLIIKEEIGNHNDKKKCNWNMKEYERSLMNVNIHFC